VRFFDIRHSVGEAACDSMTHSSHHADFHIPIDRFGTSVAAKSAMYPDPHEGSYYEKHHQPR
jgi:hypothetical protein